MPRHDTIMREGGGSGRLVGRAVGGGGRCQVGGGSDRVEAGEGAWGWGGLALWAGCFGPAQCEQSYFCFIQTILNCPKFESTKWRTS
jgi:hypothetical protein